MLLRVVLGPADGGPRLLLPDPERVLPGRGASLHLDRSCLDSALRRRAFARALRTSDPVDPVAVTAYVESHAE